MNMDLVASTPSSEDLPRLRPRLVRRIVLTVFVLGVAGMIGGSIADSNGIAMTFGLVTAVAALALVLVTSVTPPASLAKPGTPVAPQVDQRLAADLEARIDSLMANGADEAEIRRLVGRAVELGRGA